MCCFSNILYCPTYGPSPWLAIRHLSRTHFWSSKWIKFKVCNSKAVHKQTWNGIHLFAINNYLKNMSALPGVWLFCCLLFSFQGKRITVSCYEVGRLEFKTWSWLGLCWLFPAESAIKWLPSPLSQVTKSRQRCDATHITPLPLGLE